MTAGVERQRNVEAANGCGGGDKQLWQLKDRRVMNLLRIPAVVLATGSTSGGWGAHTCRLRVRILLDNLNM